MTHRAKKMIEPIETRDADADSAAAMLSGLEVMVNDFQHVASVLSVAAYGQARAGQSSIGAHMRHVLEFIQMLADYVDSGTIDYEGRERNMVYETDPKAVIAMLPQLHAKLARALERYGVHRPLLLRETAMIGGEKLTLTTSLGREVLFMLQHGVHHLAIIKMQAAAMNIHFGDKVGVAVATQAYRKQANG